jgi:aerobic carbon-monoxide dehydrogenase small subunit
MRFQRNSRHGTFDALDDTSIADEYARGEIENSPARAGSRLKAAKLARLVREANWEGLVMALVTMLVNGRLVSGEVEGRTLLVEFLRERVGLTGTHVGCDTSQCGACVVHVAGKAVKSCTAFAVACEGAEVVTIEGLAKNGKLHPMQEAFREHHGLQCGFCTPGMIMAAVDMVKRKGRKLDEDVIRHELEGNICRCTGYHNIVAAVKAGADNM